MNWHNHYFVAQTLAGDDGDLISSAFVRVEVEIQASVVLVE